MKLPAISCLCCLVVLGFAAPVASHPGLHKERDWLSVVIDAEPFNVDALLKRSEVARRHGDLVLAWEDLFWAEAISHEPHWLQRGLVCATMHLNQCAADALTEVLQVRPEHVEARVARGRAWRALGRLKDALADFELAAAQSYDVQLFLERANTQRQLGDLDGAASALRADLRRTGATVLRTALIDLEVHRGAYDAALSLVEPLLRKAGNKAQWRLMRAEILSAAQRTDERDAELALALSESHSLVRRRRTAMALVLRGRVHLAMKNTDQAILDAEAALKRSPRYLDAEQLKQEAHAARARWLLEEER